MQVNKIKFIYYNNIYEIPNKNRSIIESILHFSSILKEELDELRFIYKGKNLLKCVEVLNNKIDKNITIFVFNLNNNKYKNRFENILCKECQNTCLINYNNDIITLNNCINKHNSSYLSFKDLVKNSLFEESDIKCDICGNYQKFYKIKFFICSCNKIICPICHKNHDVNHQLYNYQTKFHRCSKHQKLYEMFCNTCNINICSLCEESHKTHKRIFLKK